VPNRGAILTRDEFALRQLLDPAEETIGTRRDKSFEGDSGTVMYDDGVPSHGALLGRSIGQSDIQNSRSLCVSITAQLMLINASPRFSLSIAF
jgi:hypothetical protein